MGNPALCDCLPLHDSKEEILNLMVWGPNTSRHSYCLPGFVCLIFWPVVVCPDIFPAKTLSTIEGPATGSWTRKILPTVAAPIINRKPALFLQTTKREAESQVSLSKEEEVFLFSHNLRNQKPGVVKVG